MKTDKDRIHRWITQADLERMLGDAYQRGAEAMRGAALCRDLKVDDVYEMRNAIGALPVPKDKP